MHVLLPVDASEDRAVAAADAVTTIPHAADEVSVTILNVHERIEVQDSDGGTVTSDEWYDKVGYPASVDTATAVLEDAGVTVERRQEHADPATAIIEVTDEIGADWIVMSGRKRTPVGTVLFGSVTQSVLLNADIPVTVITR